MNRARTTGATFKAAARCLLLPALLAAAGPALPCLARQAGAQPGPAMVGSITGRVVGEGGEPLPYAAVYVTSRGPVARAMPTATTDAEGNFRFDGLALGTYTVLAVLPAYVMAPETAGPNNYYRLGENVTIRMLKGGVVTGSVVTAAGEPVVGVGVRAIRVRDAEGRSLSATAPLGFSREFRTDDRGVYRIFGLAPGSYVVFAGGESQTGGFLPSAYAGEAPTFYPSSTRDTAAEVSVRSGQEATGIDIRYRGEPGHRITGTVAVPQSAGQAVSVGVTLTHPSSGMPVGSAWVENILGQESARPFTVAAVADGEYDLLAQLHTREGTVAASEPLRVSVRGADVTGLKIQPAALASVSGTLINEPPGEELKALADCNGRAARAAPQEVIIFARRDEPPPSRRPPGAPAAAQPSPRQRSRYEAAPDEAGAFMLRSMEQGRFRLDARPLDEGFYVRSILLPGASAPNGTLDVKTGQQLSGVVVRVAPGAALVSGRVVAREEGGPLPPFSQLRVHLLPAERERAEDLLRYAEATPSPDGSFAFRNLAPGRYLLVASPAADAAAARPAFWDAAERARLRREAEAGGAAVELQPCRREADFALRFPAPAAK